MLFVNSVQPKCGVYQYGKRMAMSLQQEHVPLTYIELETLEQWSTAILPYSVILLNYHPSLFPWISKDTELYPDKTYYYIYHECDMPPGITSKQILDTDPTASVSRCKAALPRPLYSPTQRYEKSPVSFSCPIIGSFGFGFSCKNFPRIVRLVQEQFDCAKIRLHIPMAYYSDPSHTIIPEIVAACLQSIRKKGISVEFTHHFLSDEELFAFLQSNDLNIFLYDTEQQRGCSSVFDFALSCDTPIAISTSAMFRHIYQPEISVDHTSLIEIMLSGTKHTRVYQERWSTKQLKKVLQEVLSLKNSEEKIHTT